MTQAAAMSRRVNHVWKCEICNCATNPVRAAKCTICGEPAPRTRFGTFTHGRYVLVDLRTGRNAAEARIYELASNKNHIEELPAGEDLDDRVAEVLRNALDDEFRETRRIEAPRLASRARRRHRGAQLSYEASEDAKVVRGDLFAQVLQHDRTAANAATMRKQVVTMRKRVAFLSTDVAAEDESTILIRRKNADGSVDESRVDRDEATVLIDKEAAARAMFTPCGCCEREFRGRALLGVASFQQVSMWRTQRAAPFAAKDPRRALSRRYETVKLCVFCTQFFDSDFSDYVAIAAHSTSSSKRVELEPVLGLGPSRAKDAAEVTRRRHLIEAAPVDETKDRTQRPQSMLRDRMAKSELLMRAAVPLKLDPFGSQLSDLRKPIVKLRKGFTRKPRPRSDAMKERQFTPVSKDRLEDLRPPRRPLRKLGARAKPRHLPPLVSPDDEDEIATLKAEIAALKDEPPPEKPKRRRSVSFSRAAVVEQKRRAEATAYGAPAPLPPRRRKPGRTTSQRTQRRLERKYEQLAGGARRGAEAGGGEL